MINYRHIDKILEEDLLEQAIDDLLIHCKDKSQYNTVCVLAEWLSYSKEQRPSTDLHPEYGRERNRIREVLKSCLKGWEEEGSGTLFEQHLTLPTEEPHKPRKVIFLAYRLENKSEAWRLWEELEKAGYEVIIDRNSLIAGQNIKNFVNESIKKSNIIILYLSNIEEPLPGMEKIGNYFDEINNNKNIIIILDSLHFDFNTTGNAHRMIAHQIRELSKEIKSCIENDIDITHLMNVKNDIKNWDNSIDVIADYAVNHFSIRLHSENWEKGLARLLESLEKMDIR